MFLVWSVFSCATPSGSEKVPEYSAELVLPSSVPHPLGPFLEARSYGNIVKVFASQSRIRLEAGQGQLIVIFDSSTKEGRLFLNRERPKLADPTKPESMAQGEIREFIRLPPEGGKLAGFPQLTFWTFVALKFMPPSRDNPPDIRAVLENRCRKVGEEIIAGRATEKWEACESIEYGGRIFIPIESADSPPTKLKIRADYICFIKLLPFLDPSRGFIGPDYIWIDKNLGVPVKREIDFELRNIVQARQDPSLFNFLEGYVEMP